MDGDAKINMAEFAVGMKSSLTVYAKKGGKRPKSGGLVGGYRTGGGLGQSGSAAKGNFPIRSTTPRQQPPIPQQPKRNAS